MLCLVIDKCYSQYRPYRRIKRGKYYSSPPQRFYSRPPFSFPVGGTFPYTPPSNYKDDEPPYPGSRPKVSKPPTNDGLGDEDINNLMKYLSKQDLDKILDYTKTSTTAHNAGLNEFKPNKYNEFRPSQNDISDTSYLYEKFNDNNYKTGIESPEAVFNKYSSEYSKFLHQKDDDHFRPILPNSEFSSQKYNYGQKSNFNLFATEPTSMSVYEVTSPRYPEYTSPASNNYNNLNSNYQEEGSQRYSQPPIYEYTTNPTLNQVTPSRNQQYIEHGNPGFNNVNNFNNNYQAENIQKYTQPNKYQYSSSNLNEVVSQKYTENNNLYSNRVNNLNNNYEEVNQGYTTQKKDYEYNDRILNHVGPSNSQQYIEDNKSGYNNINDVNGNYKDINSPKYSQPYNDEYINPISISGNPQYTRTNNPDSNNGNNYNNNYQNVNSQRYSQSNSYEYNNPTVNQHRTFDNPQYIEENKRNSYSKEMENTGSTVFPPYTSNNDKYNIQNDAQYSKGYDNSNDFNQQREEQLPKPTNLRDETDYEVSYTNKIPFVTSVDNYKLENFGDLPLMEYNSKLASSDSYNVPHYTVSFKK